MSRIVIALGGNALGNTPYEQLDLVTETAKPIVQINMDNLRSALQRTILKDKRGKALYLGISRWPLEATRFAIDYLAARDTPLLIYQGRLNMLDREPLDQGIIELCDKSGVGFISFSPLAQGLLTNRYLDGIPADSRMSKERFLKKSALTDSLLEQLRQWNTEAQEDGMTLAEKALKWILDTRGVTSVLIGASSVAQLQTNLGVVGKG